MPRPKGSTSPHLWTFPHDEIKTAAYIKYLRAKAQAKFRCEHWDLTWDQWWGLWDKSGKWLEKGSRADGYCMMQLDTQVGWTEDNCRIVPRQEHLSSQRKRTKSIEPNKKLTWDPQDPKFRLPRPDTGQVRNISYESYTSKR